MFRESSYSYASVLIKCPFDLDKITNSLNSNNNIYNKYLNTTSDYFF